MQWGNVQKPLTTPPRCRFQFVNNLFFFALPFSLILGVDLSHPIAGQAQLESPILIAQDQENSFWQFNAQTNQLQLMLPAGIPPRYFLLARPMRLVIDFPHPGTIAPLDFTYAGAVERLTLSSQVEGQVRVILYLRAGVELQPKQVALQQIDSQRWLITPLLVAPASPSILNEESTSITTPALDSPPNSSPETLPIASPLDPLESPAAVLEVPSLTPSVEETPFLSNTPEIQSTSPISSNTSEASNISDISDISDAPIATQTPTLPVLDSQIPAENRLGEDSSPEAPSTIVEFPPLPVQPILAPQIESEPFSVQPIAPQAQSKPEVFTETETLTETQIEAQIETQIETEKAPEFEVEVETAIEPQPLSTQPLSTQPLLTAPSSVTETTPPVNDREPRRRRARRPRTDTTSSPAQVSPPSQSAEQPPDQRPPVSLSTVPLSVAEEESDYERRSPQGALPSVSSPASPPAIISTPIGSPSVSGSQSQPMTEAIPAIPAIPGILVFGSPLPGENSSQVSPVVISNPSVSPSEEEENAPPLPLPAIGLPTGGKPPAPLNPSQAPANPLPSVPERSPVPASLPPLPIQSSTPLFFLEKGTPITLRYTGSVPLDLSKRDGTQEVLVVDEDVKGVDGSVVIPAGSEVLGRFETNWRGSRFITQAINLRTNNNPPLNSQVPQNQVIEAKSDRIDGDRALRPLNLAVGSGVGAVAGTFIAGGFGALGGIALGAATGYFISPQPATIVPYQTFVIYLDEDW